MGTSNKAEKTAKIIDLIIALRENMIRDLGETPASAVAVMRQHLAPRNIDPEKFLTAMEYALFINAYFNVSWQCIPDMIRIFLSPYAHTQVYSSVDPLHRKMILDGIYLIFMRESSEDIREYLAALRLPDDHDASSGVPLLYIECKARRERRSQ